ncbi:kinesin-3 motor protein uncA [Aspergillus candidus]|uniref:Kinesin family protein n=1 Tax=Aspergillus candidus TaxID=41067 RepID=A0A2I2FE40_ASPCN|nr:kinesin family protein [Aspergillus candidus]PLB38903.1 kinesin family protein [Aspergillus candidus]
MAPGGGGNIKVVVRVRPFNSREKEKGSKCIVQMKGDQTILIPPPNAEAKQPRKGGKGGPEGPKNFAFDRSYWSFDNKAPNYASQDNLFDDLGTPLLDNAFGGYNNCIFAYGQTGSGKSYSMMGYGKEYGVIPRICQSMFERISEIQREGNLSCNVEVSYIEIYNERVRDLLNPSNKGHLKVREHPSTGPYVEDLSKLAVRSFDEIENLMDEGNKARTVAATNMNETSSRSHAVFTLTLSQKRHDAETSMDSEKVSRISLVDLAGSERANSTGATGARLKEGAEINRSLSTLGRVIAALADVAAGKKKNASMVPYRDSILTWLLKDSLGGNSMTAMIAAISPADINYDETLGTLRYADSAKRIKNHAVVNEDPNARMIRELKEELLQLRSKLGGGAPGVAAGGAPGAGGAAPAADDYYPPDTPLEKQLVSIQKSDGSVTKVSKAEIVEQLNQSEKLYNDLNETWEEKLVKTEQIHKEREAALEELGISIEKGFVGMSTPKKMPHLVNLSDDPLLAECLVYNIKPGTTLVGNMDQGSHVEIRLNGSKIMDDHCKFENVDNVVTLVPSEGAAIMVNGQRVDKPTRLKSGFRIIMGDFHIFRFNHPQEARAERVEQSLLRHSITTSQLGSPAPNKSHDRNLSKAGSEVDGDSSRADSPMPSRGRDSDWLNARREAVSAVMGPDHISNMRDDELDALFEDVQKVRATRRGRAENDEDSDSLSSFPVRDKYMSNGTLDNFSLDTAITLPGTPRNNEDDDGQSGNDVALQSARQDLQRQLDRQKEEYQTKLRNTELSPTRGPEGLQSEKARMEVALRATKEEYERQLRRQKQAFESHMKDMGQPIPRIYENGFAELDPREIEIASTIFRHWSQQNYVRMAENVLQHASLLKEAQVMSHIMDKNVVFQFAVVDHGHNMASSYDLVLNGISGDEDILLDDAKKPCIAVRVIDFKQCVVHLWSVEKLQRRLQAMRQLHQYIDRPDYIQHFKLENPFSEPCSPQYSLIGDADIPLTAVFETRVQDFSVEVISPYTHNVVGIIRLSLEPSSAQAPSSTLKFNVVMRDMIGFAEWEGTEVHAQLFFPGISDEGGATTTQMISGFDESAVRFESVHSMSLPLSSPRTAALKICVYARVTQMHLDKLLSWDDMRDSAEAPRKKRKTPRIAESEFFSEERHDVFARIQVLEMTESGEYLPVEVVQSNSLDAGTYQLHQGLQRRVLINLTYSSTESLPWDDLANVRAGSVRLLDPWGKIPDQDLQTPDVPLKFVQEPMVKDNADGTSNVTLIGQWDSSLHGSLLLDRVTAEKYRVQVTIRWDLLSSRLQDPVGFSGDLTLQIQGRTYVRQQSMFKQLFNSTRIVHSTVRMFSLVVRPVSAKRAADLWRMNTQNDYVKGEEFLTAWAPRKISLVRDYVMARKRRHRVAELNAAKGALSASSLVPSPPRSGRSTPLRTQELTDRKAKILRKYVELWSTKTDSVDAVLVRSNTEPPAGGAAFASRTKSLASADDASSVSDDATLTPRFIATIQTLPKNPSSLKSGYLLSPDDTYTHWVRRFVELRRPYLHVYSVPEGDEINAINLRTSRVDHAPDFARLLDGPGAGTDRPNVFALYGPQNTFLFASRTEAQKVEWILKIDESYFSSKGPRVDANGFRH